MAPARIAWRLAAVTDVLVETPHAKTLVLDVPGWPGHVAGQHVDIRLTAEDGYQAQRSYSIASAPEDATLALTVERLEDGEVSSPGVRARAADGDGAPPCGALEHRGHAAAAVRAVQRRRPVPRRAGTPRSRRRARRASDVHARAARRLAGPWRFEMPRAQLDDKGE